MLVINDDQAALHTVAETAEILGVEEAFVRGLAEHGLVRPAREEHYTEDELARLEHVAELFEQGFALMAVRRVLELEDRVRELEEGPRRGGPPKPRKRASVPPI